MDTLHSKAPQVNQIYDKIIKRILTLSSTAVVNLINGLFDTDYPTDSVIFYHWTEHTDDDLHRTIADTILTINHDASYHIEAQMYQDDEIEFRVFDYGYKHALDTHYSEDRLVFPEPRILQLYDHQGMDDQKNIVLDFGTQGSFLYTVPVFKLLDHDLTYLKEKKMSILAPFMMLSLRDSIKKERTTENTEALRKLILDDIMSLIESSRIKGDITSADAIRIQSLVHRMYKHLYSHYSEFEKGGLNAMMNDGLVLDCDIWERDMKKKLTKEITEKLTKQITGELTERITEELTGQITEELTEQITEHSQSNTVQRLYAKLGDAAQVADLLDLTTERVLELL